MAEWKDRRERLRKRKLNEYLGASFIFIIVVVVVVVVVITS